jgi:hypothetical protein
MNKNSSFLTQMDGNIIGERVESISCQFETSKGNHLLYIGEEA